MADPQTTNRKSFEGSKVIKPLKAEDWETDAFECDVSSGMIFIWGGGMECCVSPRVMKRFVEWLKTKKVI
jgi:hypothetical protein